MAGGMRASLTVDAFGQAVACLGGISVVAGCIVHSDRGSQGGFNRSSQHPLGITGGMGDGKQGLGEEDQ